MIAQPLLIVQTGHVGKINDLRFSPDDKYIASAGEDGKVLIWDMKTLKQFSTLDGHAKAVTSLAFHPTEKVLISTSSDSSIILWDYINNKILHKIKKLPSPITSVSFNGAGTNIYACASQLFIYDYATRKIKDGKTDFHYKKIVPDNTGNGYLFCASETPTDNEFIGYRLNDGQTESGNFVQGKNIFCKDASTDKNFYSYDKKNELTGFSYSKGVYTKQYYALENTARFKISTIVASQKFVVMSNAEKLIYVYEGKKLNKKMVLGGHTKTPNSLAISKNEKYLISSDETGVILLWSLENGKLINTLTSAISPIADAMLNKDQESLFILYKNGNVKKWLFRENIIMHTNLNTSELVKKSLQNYYCNSILTANDSMLYFSSVRITRQINESIKQVESFEGKVNFENNKLDIEDKYSTTFANGKIYNQDWAKEPGFENFKKNSSKNGRLKTIRNTKYNFSIDINENGLMQIINDGAEKQQTTFGIFNDRDFYFSNDAGYYWSSKQALLNVGFKYQTKIYDFNQFDALYNRPDIIMSQLPFTDSTAKIASAGAYKKRIQILGTAKDFDPSTMPDLIITILEENVVSEKKYEIKLSATSNSGNLKTLFILLNGVPYPTIDGIALRGSKFDSTLFINLENGKNNVQCFVKNSEDQFSLRENFNVFFDNPIVKKPNLYLLTIGSSKFQQKDFDLQYPSKDITDVAALMNSSKVYKNVFTMELKDEAVLKSKLSTASSFLSAANEGDQIIVFYAGHGVLDKNLNYYISTYDIDFTAPEINGIAYDSLEVMLGKLKCRKKVVLMDACHSGEIDKEDLVITTPAPLKENDGAVKFRAVGNAISNKSMYGSKSSMEISKVLFADTRLNNGVNVISSAGGAEYAIEGAKWNNGVFTYSLINGLKNKEADLNKDGEVWVNELQEYLGKKVSEVTGGKQTPTSRAENLISNFRIW
jgi:WD40 repeat protein